MNNGKQAVILIVDDVPENLGLLHASLDSAGYKVLVCTDAHSALAISHQSQPDLILMDGHMPHLDGFECCSQLKSSPITHNIPIIFMTGLTETEYIIKGFKVGGVDYVTKPINISELLARIQTHLTHANLLNQQREIIDASEIAILSLNHQGTIIWKTYKAQQLLSQHAVDLQHFEQGIQHWFLKVKQCPEDKNLIHCDYSTPSQKFQLLLLSNDPWSRPQKHTLIQLKPIQQAPSTNEILKCCSQLTPREAEVLHWLILGKTNKDIADILVLSPRTVNKHLEHVFEKLYVETRTAAVSYVINRCSAV